MKHVVFQNITQNCGHQSKYWLISLLLDKNQWNLAFNLVYLLVEGVVMVFESIGADAASSDGQVVDGQHLEKCLRVDALLVFDSVKVLDELIADGVHRRQDGLQPSRREQGRHEVSDVLPFLPLKHRHHTGKIWICLKYLQHINRGCIVQGQVRAWQSATLLPIICKSIPHVPAWIEEPSKAIF